MNAIRALAAALLGVPPQGRRTDTGGGRVKAPT
jgi:hypothetical protein